MLIKELQESWQEDVAFPAAFLFNQFWRFDRFLPKAQERNSGRKEYTFAYTNEHQIYEN